MVQKTWLKVPPSSWRTFPSGRPAEPFIAAVALVCAIRGAFEVSPSGPEPDRDMATAGLRLLAVGLSGYGVRPCPSAGLQASC
jgi:hypothetical protein